MEKKGKFDYILLETTGLADPGNLAPIFWVDEGLASTIYLDGVVTLVDAKNILHSLDEPVAEDTQHHDGEEHGRGPLMTTAHLQISHADVVVINKSDLVSAEALERVTQRIRSINGLAKIHQTSHSTIPQLDGFVLDLHAYDNVTDLNANDLGHSHLDPVSCLRPSAWRLRTNAVQTISTVSVKLPRLETVSMPKVDKWLQSVLWERRLPEMEENGSSLELHRLKGRLALGDGSVKMIQGVREIFDIFDAPAQSSSSAPPDDGKIVLIGRGLKDVPFQQSIAAFLDLPDQ
jgi:G3E family GTPase